MKKQTIEKILMVVCVAIIIFLVKGFVNKQMRLDEQKKAHVDSLEKVALKDNRECDTGSIPVDALDRENGPVTVKINPIESKWNINRLYPGGDANYDKIWEAILVSSGIPPDEEELIESIVASWCDWRDEDDGNTGEYGAETEFYTQAYEDYQRNSIDRNVLRAPLRMVIVLCARAVRPQF